MQITELQDSKDSAMIVDEFKSDTVDSTSGYQPPFAIFFNFVVVYNTIIVCNFKKCENFNGLASYC